MQVVKLERRSGVFAWVVKFVSVVLSAEQRKWKQRKACEPTFQGRRNREQWCFRRSKVFFRMSGRVIKRKTEWEEAYFDDEGASFSELRNCSSNFKKLEIWRLYKKVFQLCYYFLRESFRLAGFIMRTIFIWEVKFYIITCIPIGYIWYYKETIKFPDIF